MYLIFKSITGVIKERRNKNCVIQDVFEKKKYMEDI